jgi:trans-2-enoyl-CoA reductase
MTAVPTNDTILLIGASRGLGLATRVIETLGWLVDPHGTIGVMSSGRGSVANNERGGSRSTGRASPRSTN